MTTEAQPVFDGTADEQLAYALADIDSMVATVSDMASSYIKGREMIGEPAEGFAYRTVDYSQQFQSSAREYALRHKDDPFMVAAVHYLVSRIRNTPMSYGDICLRDAIKMLDKDYEPVLVNIAHSIEWVEVAISALNTTYENDLDRTVTEELSSMLERSLEGLDRDELLSFPEEIVCEILSSHYRNTERAVDAS